jgi:hypothetical protein
MTPFLRITMFFFAFPTLVLFDDIFHRVLKSGLDCLAHYQVSSHFHYAFPSLSSWIDVEGYRLECIINFEEVKTGNGAVKKEEIEGFPGDYPRTAFLLSHDFDDTYRDIQTTTIAIMTQLDSLNATGTVSSPPRSMQSQALITC